LNLKVFLKLIFLISLISACAMIDNKKQAFTPDVKINYEYLQQADFIDIVYENDSFSYISYLKEEPALSLYRKSFSCLDEDSELPFKKSIWIWKFNEVIGKEEKIITEIKKLNFKRIYIQIDDNIEKLLYFLELARSNNIEIFAVDGDPYYIHNAENLKNRIKKVIAFNQKMNYFAGFQIDVEPYLFKDFNLNKQSYLEKYVSLIKSLKELTEGRLKFSIVIPFWFDDVYYKNRPLSFEIIDLADEIVVMSYRTALAEILQVASDELCYASVVNKPVYLALEINPLPVEEHFLVKKETVEENLIKDNTEYYLRKLPSSGLPVFRSYKVKPENLTFYNNPKIKEILNIRVKKKSFSGWVIHSFEGLKERLLE